VGLAGPCLSIAAAVGGGIYEGIIVNPLWSRSPPASFAVIQPPDGVALQRFWIPVHAGITVFALAALAAAWRHRVIRRLLLVGLASYAVMRAWSGVYFIPHMLAFQDIAPDSAPSAELSMRVARWIWWTWWRAPLDLVSFACFALAFRATGGQERG